MKIFNEILIKKGSLELTNYILKNHQRRNGKWKYYMNSMLEV